MSTAHTYDNIILMARDRQHWICLNLDLAPPIKTPGCVYVYSLESTNAGIPNTKLRNKAVRSDNHR